MPQYDLNLRDYWRILRKRKGAVVVVALAFGAMAFIFAEVQKPQPIYQATAVVKFERMTTLVGLLVENISVSAGDSLATQAAVVRSFSVLERAAKALQLIPANLDSEAIKNIPRYVQLLSDLRGQVAAAPEENTTLINITVTSSDSAQAARIANAVAQAYREENVLTRNRQVREARRFIEAQLEEVSGRLQEAEDAMRALKERRGFISLPDETTAALGRLTLLEGEYDKAHRIQEETANQIQALQDPQVAGGAVLPRIFTDTGDPTIAKLNTTLLDLGVERENLLITLTPEHPQIRELNARIEGARGNLIRELRVKLQAFQGRATDLQEQIQQIRQDQRTLPDVAQQYARLQRDLTINETLLSQLRSKFQEVQIKEKEQAEEVTLVRPATEPGQPTNLPQTAGKGIVGLLIGLTIGLVLAFVLESLDTSIGTIQDVESYLEVPVLGLVPNIDPTKDPSLSASEDPEGDGALGKMRPFLICLLSPKSTISEAYRSLRTNVDFLALERNIKTLCLTSASLMEGKTTTAINLAIASAQMGKNVLLVEADLRRPFIHHAFGIPRDPGLAEVIVGNKDWRDCVRTVTDLMLGPLGLEKVMAAPNIDKLHILTSGTPPPNPAEFLNSARMTDLIATLRQEFDIVIFDCSPILPVTDAAILASKVDGTLIVYRVGRTARAALKRAKALLENVRSKVLGIILTGVRADVSPDYEDLEYYGYAYGHEPGRPTFDRSGGSEQSLYRRAVSAFKSFGHSIKLIVLLGLMLLLAAALAVWFGVLPPEWQNWGKSLLGTADKEPPALQPLTAEGCQGSAPASRIEEAILVKAAFTPPLPVSESAIATNTGTALPLVEAPRQKRVQSTETSYPFSVQVSSRQDPIASLTFAETLRKEDLKAFTVPARIPGKGLWYRVLIGGFDSTVSAAEAARNLLVMGRVKETLVVSLPYAVEIAGLVTSDRAANAMAVARRAGYLPMPLDGGKPTTDFDEALRINAFRTLAEAQSLVDSLRAEGFDPRVIRR